MGNQLLLVPRLRINTFFLHNHNMISLIHSYKTTGINSNSDGE